MITPVILCGGSGTRLWPLSRKSYPKQFAPLIGEETLFQATALRFYGDDFGKPLILTNSDFRFIVTQQLSEIEVDPLAVVIEPSGKNTAPAVLAAALWLYEQDPEAMMLVAPSDHVVLDTDAFSLAVERGYEEAKRGALVTFGVSPTSAETGYGYLEVSGKQGLEEMGVLPLSRFVEKPCKERATEMLNSGKYLWNAGIFLFSAKTILESFREHADHLLEPVKAALDLSSKDLGFLRLDPRAWFDVQDISLDYAVMEKAKNVSVVSFSAGWSDLGSWDAVLKVGTADSQGVVTSGHATALDCKNTLLRSEDDSLEIVGLGLENIVAVAMPDAVLISHTDRVQDVKRVVSVLDKKGSGQAVSFPKDHRPWGWFQSIAVGDRFQVKRIVVHPGSSLSLQSHLHRAEHWIVVKGVARITIDDLNEIVNENESVYIPIGAKHRLENPGKVEMVLIEVQTGSYLGEDDIVRYEDVYNRSSPES